MNFVNYLKFNLQTIYSYIINNYAKIRFINLQKLPDSNSILT
jgi:hypothetical protein